MGVPYQENAEGIDCPDEQPWSTNNRRPGSTKSGHKGRSRILSSAFAARGALSSSGDADAAGASQPLDGLGLGKPHALPSQHGQGMGQAAQDEYGVLGQIFCHEPVKLDHMLVEVLENGRAWQGEPGQRAGVGGPGTDLHILVALSFVDASNRGGISGATH